MRLALNPLGKYTSSLFFLYRPAVVGLLSPLSFGPTPGIGPRERKLSTRCIVPSIICNGGPS